jgi:Aromatic-ring-opening dioxygenase LigAB, LigA subunit
MSLYGMQKFLYHLNRDEKVQAMFRADRGALLAAYTLTDEERDAIERGDTGLLYVLGANGQLLMYFAAFLGMLWPEYLQSMRDGVAKHGPVRAGVYTMTTKLNEKVAGI